MLLNCYYYAPHNHTLLGKHLRADLEHMRGLGVDAVSLCVQEEQLFNWHSRRLRNVVELARSLGLQVFAVPNRWCGLVAGWLDGYSTWTVEHAHTFCNGASPPAVSNPAHPEVRAHYEKSLRALLLDYPFDGVVWDEPRSVQPELVQFLDTMSAYAKTLRPGLTVSLFAESGRLETAPHYAATRHIDYLGSDGHVRDESHRMHRMKNTIFQAHEAFHPLLTAAGKKTMYLLEAQRHRDEDLEAYLAAIDRAFALPMDQMMFYYSAHEMSAAFEDRFNEATWAAVASAKRGAAALAR
jgi:hypothetical protein